MLVASLREVVYAANVTPEVLRGKIGDGYGFVGPGVGDLLAILESDGGRGTRFEGVDMRRVVQGKGRGRGNGNEKKGEDSNGNTHADAHFKPRPTNLFCNVSPTSSTPRKRRRRGSDCQARREGKREETAQRI